MVEWILRLETIDGCAILARDERSLGMIVLKLEVIFDRVGMVFNVDTWRWGVKWRRFPKKFFIGFVNDGVEGVK